MNISLLIPVFNSSQQLIYPLLGLPIHLVYVGDGWINILDSLAPKILFPAHWTHRSKTILSIEIWCEFHLSSSSYSPSCLLCSFTTNIIHFFIVVAPARGYLESVTPPLSISYSFSRWNSKLHEPDMTSKSVNPVLVRILFQTNEILMSNIFCFFQVN